MYICIYINIERERCITILFDNIYIYIYMYVYSVIYIYIYIHIHTYRLWEGNGIMHYIML